MAHLSTEELTAALAGVAGSPADHGTLELIVRRPEVGAREVVEHAQLDPATGLVGDRWSRRSHAYGDDGLLDPETQLTLMNARVAALIAGDRSRWPLAGDQLFVDFDLSRVNAPPGTRLRIGAALVEISATPHTGCGKFVTRFGADAMKFVNSPRGRDLRLRGVNAKVIEAGAIRRGDAVTKLDA